jgi:hypothetical protein
MALINKTAVRELALHVARERFKSIPGYGKERVSEDFLNRMEAELRSIAVRRTTEAVNQVVAGLEEDFRSTITRIVNGEPAGGKTL